MTKQEKAALVSIATDSVLTLVKFLLAWVTASVALLAEAYHSFADILSSTMVLMALRADRRDRRDVLQAQRPLQEGKAASASGSRFFAPGNWENKAAIGIGVLLIFAALNIFSKVSQSDTIDVRYPLFAAIVVSVLALCSYFLYRFEISVGRDTDSTALIADGRHAQTDMLASALVVFALVASSFGVALDRIAAGIIGFYILIEALHILTQGARSYAATMKGQAFSHHAIYEDILFALLCRVASRFEKICLEQLQRFPGLSGSREVVKKRASVALLAFAGFVVACLYALSGFYVLQPGERAIVERFGRPLQRNSFVGPGLHYRWPWPVERVKKADVEGIRRLVVGYMSGNREAIILWTNKHYLREYSVITGEGPFLDVAMNVHYRIGDLYDYLYINANPDGTTEKVAYQVLRETFGTRPLFSSITADRDALENLILAEIQRRTDKLALGIQVQGVCFRDLHPPTQVAAAFEDVVSAQEDYETYIEQARGYQKDLLPRARASAMTAVNDAQAYRTAIIAQSIGKAQSFSLQEKAYSEAPDLTRTRMLLETLEEALASIPKYIVGPGEGSEKPDLWFHMPSLARGSSAPGTVLETGPEKAQDNGELAITDEGDLMDALVRFQRGRRGDAK